MREKVFLKFKGFIVGVLGVVLGGYLTFSVIISHRTRNRQCSNCEKRSGGLDSSAEGTRFEAP